MIVSDKKNLLEFSRTFDITILIRCPYSFIIIYEHLHEIYERFIVIIAIVKLVEIKWELLTYSFSKTIPLAWEAPPKGWTL